MSTGNDPQRRWPAWAEPLRPDDVTRARLARQIMARARPLLGARRESWQDVASGWASMLAPLAAVLLLFFTALAYRASDGGIAVADLGPEPVVEFAPPSGPATVEELVGGGEAAPWLLTGAEEPSTDALLTAVMEPAPAPAAPGER